MVKNKYKYYERIYRQIGNEFGEAFILMQIKNNLGLIFNDPHKAFIGKPEQNLYALFAVAKTKGFHATAVAHTEIKNHYFISNAQPSIAIHLN